jgi:aryl-alcohol dehydrogenase-like predicted oxidoreductase
MEEENIKREELIICSKGGFIQLEYPFPENPYTWINENLIQSSLAKEEDIELDQHCMTPDYLEWSCKRSLKNLEIDTIDIYFLHNPEIQISKLGYKTWLKKVESAFKRFERMVFQLSEIITSVEMLVKMHYGFKNFQMELLIL